MPSAQAELPYEDWAKLVGGLMDTTPLGRIVQTRAETDPKIIAQMDPWAKKIRGEWAQFKAQQILRSTDPRELQKQMTGLEQMIAKMFGGGS